ncbi:MAG: asparagine synthase (glutamine-hydrolyzing) [Candidatus Omnitrophica bacterium]|nr:asparagine synthase (glutamine-hydrolyzing) [Candidatus Omnitrophota bacterium]
MCGIAGIINYSQSNISEQLIRKMCSQMIHRGPDGEGIYAGANAGLGHRRLKIIDLSEAGRQPMRNEDGTLQLVLNGEIYNYRQLRRELEGRGHRFISCSDAEVVVHLYEDFAEGCLSYLQGMFALAVWDSKKGRLFLARDRLGKKPLLYYYDGQHFCFASEFRALLSSGLIDKEINYNAINQYLTFGYIPAPNTIYNKIFKLLPAHYGILQDNKFRLQKYWELEYSPKIIISEEEAAEELLRILKEAVKRRLASDVPLGAFLSGGIDSSTVVALMSQLTGKVKTFSVGFDDADFDELKYARNIAELFSTEHHEFVVRPKALEVLPLLVERYGEPYADSSAIPTYYVSCETKKFVTVALNGDGGDESFAGYERYQAMKLAESYNRLPLFFREAMRKVALRLLPDSPHVKNRRRKIRRFLENVSMPFYPRYCRWVSMISYREKDMLYHPGFKQQLDNYNPADWLRDYPALPNDMGLVDRLLATDIKTNLANDLLVKMDIASMANSLETRAPFLDQDVMQFSARLPGNFKIKGLIKKYILKKAIKNLIPAENIYRAKMGFGVPVGTWMRNELKDFTREILFSSRALKRGYFNPDNLRGYINRHIDGNKDHSLGLWSLLMLELWHQRFID